MYVYNLLQYQIPSAYMQRFFGYLVNKLKDHETFRLSLIRAVQKKKSGTKVAYRFEANDFFIPVSNIT